MSNHNESNPVDKKFVQRQFPNDITNGTNASHSHLSKSTDRHVKSQGVAGLLSPPPSNGGVNNGLSSCPYAQEMLNGSASSNNDSNDTTASKTLLDYTTYLQLDFLSNSVQCRSHSDPFNRNSAPVHDEHFFIIVHQAFELWFKAFLFELDSIREIFENPDDVLLQLFYINLRLHRSVCIWNMLNNMVQLLETMTPVEFLAFRDAITPASGFQSLQFRIIEARLGLTDKSRESYKMKYFTDTMFKGKQTEELTQATKEISLLKLVERWLEHVYDSINSFDFLQEFKVAVDRFIQHTEKESLANMVDAETARRQADTMHRQFACMLDKDEYEKLLTSGERRMSHKAMLSAVMISLYHEQPCFQQSYQMLYLLMDIDTLIASWRQKHILLVQRQIGRKPGTGGTGGFSYLTQTLSQKYQVFVDLFNVSSYLIPKHFLPTVVGLRPEPATSISELQFQPPPDVPINN